jgi:hypothetical protein
LAFGVLEHVPFAQFPLTQSSSTMHFAPAPTRPRTLKLLHEPALHSSSSSHVEPSSFPPLMHVFVVGSHVVFEPQQSSLDAQVAPVVAHAESSLPTPASAPA